MACPHRIVSVLFIAALGFACGCSDTTPAAPAPAVRSSIEEPFYTPNQGVTVVMADNMDRYTDVISMGALPYEYTGPQFTPEPSSSQQSIPVDTVHHQVIAPGRGGTGKALRMIFPGGAQTGARFATVNLPAQPDNETVYIQYFARVTTPTDWPAQQSLAIKWMEAWHNHATGRLQFNTRWPSRANTKTPAPTVWQVVDQAESPTNGDQPLGPYFHEIADGEWHRYTYAIKAHRSPTVKDGFAKMWIDGTLIVDVEQATVGVTPPGGVTVWCSQADVNHMAANDGTRFLILGDVETTDTGSWMLDIDDLLWWRQ